MLAFHRAQLFDRIGDFISINKLAWSAQSQMALSMLARSVACHGRGHSAGFQGLVRPRRYVLSPDPLTASEDSSLGPTVGFAHPVKEQCQPARIAAAVFVSLEKVVTVCSFAAFNAGS